MKTRAGFTRTRTAALAALLLVVPASGDYAEGQDALLTNASGGAFRSDQRFWFSVPDGQRLRLAVDGKELYRGAGPSSASMNVDSGQDKVFDVLAERRSAPPEDAVLESRAYRVRIDKAAPPSPSAAAEAKAGGGWTLRFAEAADAAAGEASLVVVLDDGAAPRVLRPAGAHVETPGLRASGVAWRVDEAGNASAPAVFSFEPFSLEILSPAPGTWANAQRLVLRASGAEKLRWSADGSDPLGPGGKDYAGPVLVDAAGAVRLSVAAVSADGAQLRREIAYSNDGSLEGRADLAPLRALESGAPASGALEGPAEFAVPADLRWDLGEAAVPASPAFRGGRNLTLRPAAGLARLVPLYLSAGGVPARFSFLLGSAPLVQARVPAAAPELAPGPARPGVVGAGKARVLAWSGGPLRLRLGPDAPWSAYQGPVPLPPEGAAVEWMAETANGEGPVAALAVPAAPAGSPEYPEALPLAAPSRDGSGVLLAAPPAGGLRFSVSAPGVSRDFYARLAALSTTVLDACDGEDLEWVLSASGPKASRLAFRTDRRPPPAPVVAFPQPGSWLSGPPALSASSPAARVRLSVAWTAPGGRAGAYDTVPGTVLAGLPTDAPVSVVVAARAVDAAGNTGEESRVSFTVDSSCAYAGLSAAAGPGNGSRDAPFRTLDDALAFARSSGRFLVRVSSSAELAGPAELYPGLSVEGGWTDGFEARGTASRLRLRPGASLSLASGAASLSNLAFVETGVRSGPLLRLRGGALQLAGIDASKPAGKGGASALALSGGGRLSARDCLFSGAAPVISAESSSLDLVSCLVGCSALPEAAAGRGAPAPAYAGAAFIRSSVSSLRAEKCRFEYSAAPAKRLLGVEAQGGALLLLASVMDLSAAESATDLGLKNVSFTADGLSLGARAAKFASCLSASGGSVAWMGGSLSASAQDAVAALLDASGASRFDGAAFDLAGSGVVRAVQARGAFPALSNCDLRASGGAGAEALAGDVPAKGSVFSNRFTGFEYLFARSFDLESLPDFNSRFAKTGFANEAAELPAHDFRLP